MTKRIVIIVFAIILAGAGLYLRAQNTQNAHNQADAIVRQDKANVDQTAAVARLKTYIAAHGGASAGFTLSGSYDRAVNATLASDPSVAATSQLYVAAQQACAGKTDSITQARCNIEYISEHHTAVPSPQPPPRSSDYQYYIVAPFWTPDLSGLLLLGAVIALVVGGLTFVARPKRHVA